MITEKNKDNNNNSLIYLFSLMQVAKVIWGGLCKKKVDS